MVADTIKDIKESVQAFRTHCCETTFKHASRDLYLCAECGKDVSGDILMIYKEKIREASQDK